MIFITLEELAQGCVLKLARLSCNSTQVCNFTSLLIGAIIFITLQCTQDMLHHESVT